MLLHTYTVYMCNSVVWKDYLHRETLLHTYTTWKDYIHRGWDKHWQMSDY